MSFFYVRDILEAYLTNNSQVRVVDNDGSYAAYNQHNYSKLIIDNRNNKNNVFTFYEQKVIRSNINVTCYYGLYIAFLVSDEMLYTQGENRLTMDQFIEYDTSSAMICYLSNQYIKIADKHVYVFLRRSNSMRSNIMFSTLPSDYTIYSIDFKNDYVS